MPNKTPKVTVVIPYYQTESGILRKSVLSALNQKKSTCLEIVIVDDGSPVSATSEIPDLVQQYPGKIKIIQQANSGPGAARNTGISNASPDTKYIAFLDSDDEWTNDHLEIALRAMKNGAKFYFSNFTQLDQHIGAIERAGKLHPEICETVVNDDLLLKYTGNMADQIATGNIIGTSTVVYDLTFNPDKRFDTSFSNAGEDYLMWLSLIESVDTIFFTKKITCKYGRGVNIYSGAEWGTLKLSNRIRDEIKYKTMLLNSTSISAAGKATVQNQIFELRKSRFKNLLSLVKSFRLSDAIKSLRLFNIQS